MKVTIHQPNFAPWVGFFDKMTKADVFVLLDTVPFTKGGFQNRVKIKGSSGPQWLTVPVLTKGRMGQLTNEVEVNDDLGWRDKHLKTLHTCYGKAPNFDQMISLVESVYQNESQLLSQLCADLIRKVSAVYEIPTKIVDASELSSSGSSSQLLADIVRELGGTEYLSGPSGKNYLDLAPFEKNQIKVSYHSFTPKPYPQLNGDFIAGLSILDHLANVGQPGALPNC